MRPILFELHRSVFQYNALGVFLLHFVRMKASGRVLRCVGQNRLKTIRFLLVALKVVMQVKGPDQMETGLMFFRLQRQIKYRMKKLPTV